MRNSVLGAFVGLSGVLALAHPASARSWETYCNSRYLYEICYPSDLLTPQPEADNGDGRVFTGAGGESLRVWGAYNATDESLADAAKDLVPEGGTVTYRHLADKSAVVSGKAGGSIFYGKVLFEKGDAGTLRSFVLTYPASEAATYDPIAARLAKCFRAAH